MSNPIVKRSMSDPTDAPGSNPSMHQNATPCNTFSNVEEDPETFSKVHPNGSHMMPNPETDSQPFRRDSQLSGRPVDIAPLTDRQLQALNLLVLGQTESRIAETIGVDRSTVWRWKQHHPLFKAELSRRRQELWGAAADRFRRTLFAAVKTLRQHLRHEQAIVQFRAAKALLMLAGADCFAPPEDSTDPNDYLNVFALARRNEIHESDFQKEPATDGERKSALATLLAKANGDVSSSSEREKTADGADFADENQSAKSAV